MIEDNKRFWNRTAGIYTRFIYGKKKAREAYEEMTKQICSALNLKMDVLEIACGPGILSYKIIKHCRSLEATDFSKAMIEEAKKENISSKLHFSVQDATSLPYAKQSFDAVVMANALHIMPEPALALENIKKVLKDDGIFICPTFCHDSLKKGFIERMMEFVGFKTYNRWTFEEFLDFLKQNQFDIIKSHKIYGHNFPIAFVIAKK